MTELKGWKLYIRNIAVAVDQFFNSVTGGDPDETISSRSAKNKDKCLLCKYLCKILNLIDKNHCEESLESDEGNDAVK